MTGRSKLVLPNQVKSQADIFLPVSIFPNRWIRLREDCDLLTTGVPLSNSLPANTIPIRKTKYEPKMRNNNSK